jgi:Phage tail tube protein
MTDRIAGVGSLTVDGVQIATRANLTVSPDPVEREMLAGQDRVHGYREMPRVPYIETDSSLQVDFPIESLILMINVTVIADLADGRIFVLREGVYKAPTEINTHDGQFKIRFEGVSCEEIQ